MNALFLNLSQTERYPYLKFVIYILIIAAYLGLSSIFFSFHTKLAFHPKEPGGSGGCRIWNCGFEEAWSMGHEVFLKRITSHKALPFTLAAYSLLKLKKQSRSSARGL
jgi:hypothetical protein